MGVMRTGASALDDAEDLGFAEDDQFFTIELDVVAGVLAEEHLIAYFEGYRAQLAVLQQLALTHVNDLALIGLFLGAARQYDATSGGLFLFLAANDHAVVQRTNFHLPILPKIDESMPGAFPGLCVGGHHEGVHRVALFSTLRQRVLTRRQ